ncbi:MAG: large subunit ribosomal protein L13 [Bradymonadia bacterium]|jgi:large subunit ribosomal protein L13
MKTISVKTEDAARAWHVVDLEGQTVGRVATKIASILRGKHKTSFTPHNDCGDFVVAVNAEKVVLTGAKLLQKTYARHSGYPGGIKEETAQVVLEKYPERIIFQAVKGMLPKNSLGRRQLKKFKIYNGADHPHSAQNPQPLPLG